MISNGHLQHQPSTLGSTVLRCCVITRRSLVIADAASAADTSTTCRKEEQVRCTIADTVGTTAASAALLAREVSQRRQVREHELDRPTTTVTHVHYKA